MILHLLGLIPKNSRKFPNSFACTRGAWKKGVAGKDHFSPFLYFFNWKSLKIEKNAKRPKLAQLWAAINPDKKFETNCGIARWLSSDFSLRMISSAAFEKYEIWRNDLPNSTDFTYGTGYNTWVNTAHNLLFCYYTWWRYKRDTESFCAHSSTQLWWVPSSKNS